MSVWENESIGFGVRVRALGKLLSSVLEPLFPNCNPWTNEYETYAILEISILFLHTINRTGVARAVLQTPLSFINS